MDPVRALLYISKLRRADKAPRFSGRGPMKEFTDKERDVNAGQCGMVLMMCPVSRLLDTSNDFKFANRFSVDGKVDVKELNDNIMWMRVEQSPRDMGISPVILARDKSRITREVRLPMLRGIVPPILPPIVAWDKLRLVMAVPLQLTPIHSQTLETG